MAGYEVRVPSITVAAYYLRNAAPDQFDQLLSAIRKHVVALTNDLTHASTEDILKAQGRAQQAQYFLTTLERFEDARPKEPPPQ